MLFSEFDSVVWALRMDWMLMGTVVVRMRRLVIVSSMADVEHASSRILERPGSASRSSTGLWESVFLRRLSFTIVTHGECSLPTFGAAFFIFTDNSGHVHSNISLAKTLRETLV